MEGGAETKHDGVGLKLSFALTALLAMSASCTRHESSNGPATNTPRVSSAPVSPLVPSTSTERRTGGDTWTTAYRAGGTDSAGHPMAGTELRSLVPFQGKLFAGLGYWKDTAADDPALPGAQVLVLNAAHAAWRVDLGLDDVLQKGPQAGRRRYQAIGALGTMTFTTDAKGVTLAAPVTLLAAGPWSRADGVDVFVRGDRESQWVKSSLGEGRGNVRAFADHVDGVTHASRAFAGSDFGIFAGTFDPARNTIVWSTSAEPFAKDDTPSSDWRVMAFATANGHLYATIGPAIYQRSDGAAPSWRRVYTATFPPEVDIKANGGLRGLAAISNPKGSGEVLLVAAGGPTARVLRVDPATSFSETVDVDVVALLAKAWNAPVRGALLAYNDMLSVKDPRNGETALLMGLEARVANQAGLPFATWFNFRAEASFLLRHADGTYDVRTIEDRSVDKPPPRVAVRTMALSPFEKDVVYAGGFDANDHPSHETAWASEGPLGKLFEGRLASTTNGRSSVERLRSDSHAVGDRADRKPNRYGLGPELARRRRPRTAERATALGELRDGERRRREIQAVSGVSRSCSPRREIPRHARTPVIAS